VPVVLVVLELEVLVVLVLPVVEVLLVDGGDVVVSSSAIEFYLIRLEIYATTIRLKI
jgi:hypothetical protein